MKWKQVLICIILATAGSAQASADSTDSGCLFYLSTQMGVDNRITIATIRNRVFNGRLTSIDLANQTLTFVHTAFDSVQYTFQANELQLVRYHENRSFKAGYALLGMALGTAIGLGVGTAVTSGSGVDDLGAAYGRLILSAAGGLVGLLLGILITMHGGSTTLECP
ncbi:MAG: hypothetical protein KAU35_07630 [candidate division Zixibacteria bacterium]|nr:hypothetical protein [candidate division Zixibacteria bacterium]